MNIPQSLIDSLRSGKLVPFVGAGVSKTITNKDGGQLFPDWKKLLQLAATTLDAEQKIKDANLVRAYLDVDQPKYLEAAQHARTALGAIWFEFLKKHLDPSFEQVDTNSLALPRAVWGLGSKLIVTTNYDRVLQWGCPNAQNHRSLDIEQKAELAALLRDGAMQPTVWHFHGKIDNAAELILTTDDYGRLYPDNGEAKYSAALETLKNQLASKSLLFIGFSFDDKNFDAQFRYIREIFNGAIGPHYILVREGNSTRNQQLSDAGLHVITFTDYGPPLIELIQEISQHRPTLPQIQTFAAKPMGGNIETRQPKVRIAILSASPIDRNYDYEDLLHEFRKLKADIVLQHLSLRTLNNLENFDYIFILSKLVKMKVAIEDELLTTRWACLKDLEENIGNSNTKGIFIFLDHQNKADLDPSDLKLLTQPTLIFPSLNKNQISSISFKIFAKRDLAYAEEIWGENLERLEVYALKGVTNLTKNRTPLPANIDPRTTNNYVGRRTDLENICRKIIELRDGGEILTIKGSGGLGKTITVKKLAVEFAARNYFDDGIDFIDCEFIGDFKAFEDNIARCFNLENALNLRDQISERLRNQDRLIILDNVETLLHLASSEPIKEFMSFVSEFATIVVTSRELIGLESEQPYELRPFTTDEAYALFERELPWRNRITEEDKRIIRQEILESLLDNNPLAIKLITKNIPIGKRFQDLKSELETNFFQKVSQTELEVFDSATDVNIERKKSLYGSINFSYQYLNDKEKVAFELLSLFPDGINLENFKKISKERKSDRTSKNKKQAHSSEELLITDPIIKALENKSLIQNDNNKIRLQSIIGKFAERQFRQRSNAELERYYMNAFSYNREFAYGLSKSFRNAPPLVTKIFNDHQNNFIKCVRYLPSFKFNHDAFLNYIDDLHFLFTKIAATGHLKQAIEEQNYSFDNEKEQLCYDVSMLSLDYYDGNFSESFSRLQTRLPLSQIPNLDHTSAIDEITIFRALHLYSYEGEALLAAKNDILCKRRFADYPAEFFQLGYFNRSLLSKSAIDFFTLDTMHCLGLLTQEIVKTYIRQGIFEKSHLEMTQAHYLMAKMGLLKKQSIKALVAVNPYTEGLKQLMFALVEKDEAAKEAYFNQALQNLTHIKYYYVEALYYYAQFLRGSLKEDKFNEIFQLGIGLARKHYYRYQLYRYEELVAKTSHQYDMNKYPLPEIIDFDGYASYLLKADWRN